MLNLIVALLIIALIAAVLGFGGLAGAAVGLAKVLFYIVLMFFLIAGVFGEMGALLTVLSHLRGHFSLTTRL